MIRLRLGKLPLAGRRAERVFADDAASVCDAFGERPVARRIKQIGAGADDRHVNRRRATHPRGRRRRCQAPAPRPRTGRRRTTPRRTAAAFARPCSAGVAAADHRQRRPASRPIPSYIEQQGRIGNSGEHLRIARVAQRQHIVPGRLHPASVASTARGAGATAARKRARQRGADVGPAPARRRQIAARQPKKANSRCAYAGRPGRLPGATIGDARRDPAGGDGVRVLHGGVTPVISPRRRLLPAPSLA